MSKKIDTNANRHPNEDRMSVKERCLRLKIAVQVGGGNTAVSDKSGIPKPTLSTYTSGRDMKANAAVSIAKACGVSLKWLLAGEGDMYEQDSDGDAQVSQSTSSDLSTYPIDKYKEINDNDLTIPFFQTAASAGSGILADEWEEAEQVTISKNFLRSFFGFLPSKLLLIRARGDSMQPTIQSQDVMIVNYAEDDDLRPGIYILSVGGAVLVKRLDMKDPRTYEVISDNKDYNSFDVPMNAICWGNAEPDAEVRVIGKVMGFIHLED